MKKFLSVLLVLTMVLSLAGCKAATEEKTGDATTESSTTDTAKDTTATDATATDTTATEATDAAPTVYPAEKVLIGVELYDPTESETLEIQKYFAYLAENFNIEFKYSEAIQDAEQEMKFIEDCAIAGCKGFYGYYNVSGFEQVAKVEELGMYFYGGSPEIYEVVKNDANYLGVVTGNGSDYENGKALGQWVMDQGFTNVIYANGGADFGVGIFVERQAGFLDAIDDTVTVTTVRGFPSDQFFADQAAALATPGVQAVVASFNGVDFWAQPIASAGLTDVKLATIGAVNESYKSAFENNQLSFLVAGNIQTVGFGVASILNAIDGNADIYKEDGTAIEYSVPTFTITSAEEITKILDVQNNEKLFSADDLKSLILSLNPDATMDGLKALADSKNKESILSK